MPTQPQMINYSPIGMVSILMGIGLVEGPDGLTRFLQVGDELHAEDTVHVVGDGDAEITFLDGSHGNVHGGQALHLDADQFNMDHVGEGEGDFRILRSTDVLQAEPEEDLARWLEAELEYQAGEGMIPAVTPAPLEYGSVPEYGDYMLGLGCLMAETDQCFSITSVDDPDCDLQPTEYG